VTFNDDASLDTSQVGGGGRGFPGGGLAVGGGGLGIVGIIVYLIISAVGGGSAGGGLPSQLQPGQNGAVSADEVASECKTGADANKRIDCRIVGYTNSVQDYWKKTFGTRNGGYQTTRTIMFQGSVQTGCGTASSATGPFYCPTDGLVYMDIGFFDELSSRFGAKGGPLAQAYVVAHEYGHHVQNLLGTSDRVGRDQATGPESGSVRLELQADCYAGVWTKNASSTTDANGRPLLQAPTQEQISQALDAAAAVGDDRIQQRTQGRVSPEGWTHGSSEQRQRWFSTGYRSGNPSSCDTFSGDI
jgi:predicted metalloprotease